MKTFSEQLAPILELLKAAPPHSSTSELMLFLKKRVENIRPEILAVAVDTFHLRQEASRKLGSWASDGFFSSTLLPQASRITFASYRASYFNGCNHILEIGTGTGSDTASLARVAKQVTTLEIDPVRAELAKQNLEIQGIKNVNLLVGSLSALKSSLRFQDFDGLYADPARRLLDGTRIKDPKLYSPPLEDLLTLPIEGVGAIKISPGLFLQTPPRGWVRQFLGFEQECLEQTLWKNTTIADCSTKLVDTGEYWAPPSTAPTTRPAYAQEIGRFFYEAHGVVNRSLHLEDFFAQFGINRIAPSIAYGTSNTHASTSRLLTSYSVLCSFPFSRKELHNTLRRLQWSSRTEFKKRGFDGDLDSIRSEMKLPLHTNTALFGAVFFFKWNKKTWVVLGTRND